MIFCHDKVYAKVWKVTKAEKYLDLQITTSEKNQDGEYINSGWFPRVIGHAFNSLKDTLSEGDRIIITKCKLSNERYTAKDGTKKSAFRFLILEAEIEGKESQAPTNNEPAQNAAKDDDDCPW